MKFVCAAALLSLTTVTAHAEDSATLRAVSVVSTQPIIHERDLKHLEVWEWERDGVQHNAWAGDGQTAPYDAVKIDARLYNFPSGQLRKLYFEKGARTPWHLSKDQDLIFYYTLRQVEFVDDQVVIDAPGDVSMHPSGVMHHSEVLQAGPRLEFAFAPQGKSGKDLIALPGREMTLHEATESVEGGHRVVTYGKTDKAGAKFTAKLFQFPGYLLVEAHLPKGETLPVHKNADEKLLYVLEGRLKVTSDTATDEVGPGDMVRQIAGRPFAREALEDSVVLELDGSKNPKD